MRWTSAAACLLASFCAIASVATPADARRKPARPALLVQPHARPVLRQNPDNVQLPRVDWGDELRWRPMRAGEINAMSHVERRCSGGLVLEARPSGTVLTPREHCWWATRPEARFP